MEIMRKNVYFITRYFEVSFFNETIYYKYEVIRDITVVIVKVFICSCVIKTRIFKISL